LSALLARKWRRFPGIIGVHSPESSQEKRRLRRVWDWDWQRTVPLPESQIAAFVKSLEQNPIGTWPWYLADLLIRKRAESPSVFHGKTPDFISIDVEGLDTLIMKTLDFRDFIACWKSDVRSQGSLGRKPRRLRWDRDRLGRWAARTLLF
jgi:hypothetical protein